MKDQSNKEIWFVSGSVNESKYKWKRRTWKLVYQFFFKISPYPLSSFRIWLLKMFGAKIGKSCYVSPTFFVNQPWYLEIGNNTSIDDDCRFHAPVKIGNQCWIAAGVKIIAGGHNIKSRNFEQFYKPIVIGDGVFIGAFSYISGGVTIGDFAAIGANSFVLKPVTENKVAFGNPATIHSDRIAPDEFEKYRFDKMSH